jgi:hypothetical protein
MHIYRLVTCITGPNFLAMRYSEQLLESHPDGMFWSEKSSDEIWLLLTFDIECKIEFDKYYKTLNNN